VRHGCWRTISADRPAARHCSKPPYSANEAPLFEVLAGEISRSLARSLVVQSARVRIHAARRNLLRIAYDRATRSLMPTQASGRNYLSRAKNTLTRPTTTHRRRAHASRTSVPRGKIRALDTSHHAVASAAPPAPIALVEFSRSAGIVRVARRTPSEIDLFQANHAHAPTRHKITRTQDHTRSQEHTRSALHIRGEWERYRIHEKWFVYVGSFARAVVEVDVHERESEWEWGISRYLHPGSEAGE